MKKCRLCNNPTLKIHLIVKNYVYYKCNNCELVQITDEPSNSDLNNIYNTQYFQNEKYKDISTLRQEHNRRKQLISTYIKGADKKILDFGCGAGDFSFFLKEYYDVFGHDFSNDGINLLYQKNQELFGRFTSGNLSNLIKKKVIYDSISMWDVIEHIWDLNHTLSVLLNILKDGGYLFISTPFINSIMARVMGKYWYFVTPPEHLNFFTLKTFNYFCKKNNCSIIFSNTFGKYVNLGFSVYKLKRIFPNVFPKIFESLLYKSKLNKLRIYVPSNDILYIVIKKNIRTL